MGLNVVVGALAAAKESEDEDGFNHLRMEFSKVNKLLRANGLPEHDEPEELGHASPYDADMGSYSALHCLRRVAAYKWIGKGLPPPCKEDPDDDPVVQQYNSAVEDLEKKMAPKGLFRRSAPGKWEGIQFEHLMCHSDAEGFYVPVDFEHLVLDTYKIGISGYTLGSSQRLMEECRVLAEIIGLPLDQDPDSDEVWRLVEAQGQGDAEWKRHGLESFTCLRLFHACKASVGMKAAIVFQ